jgi:uncharacterized protein
MSVIGKVAAIEKNPTTIDYFFFWTESSMLLNPFDVIKVNHLRDSVTFGVIEEISHITDAPSYLTSYISSDFGDVNHTQNMPRLAMSFVKAKVIGNSKKIYVPVRDGELVSFASANEISKALGLDKIKHALPCGYLEMYSDNQVTLPVYFDSHFLIGPEGAHLNISGISGLASKTSYAMFLLKAIQEKCVVSTEHDENIAFIVFNTKGRDLLALDEKNMELEDRDKEIYKKLGLTATPFENVKYFYPYGGSNHTANSYVDKDDLNSQIERKKAYLYKYIYEGDGESLELLFANDEDTTGTMESIVNYILTESEFDDVREWKHIRDRVDERCQKGSTKNQEITIASWRKFKRILGKSLNNSVFANRCDPKCHEVRLREQISQIEKNDVFVVDIAKLDENMQGFVFGSVIKSVYDLKLGQLSEKDIPTKIIIFVDELNKYASTDISRNSPVLKQLLDVTERGRSLGIVLFSAEQFRSAIHDRVKGNCATHAYGRTNEIEISKTDYRFIPNVYKSSKISFI